ncbi:hypothetical protein OIU34_33755 [Pararhizobium sp. BT-229]|uniref:hypothetical protein n=1 Tax=Pararhizobium sp. BT-229 TaxID=2986923 RepID=UPI0021F72292|nr:hypothetical protein [Pararhizobium sp. BT-229]MCV9966821.1 hypothetical protein [Pararhizobium sp. BT-229]
MNYSDEKSSGRAVPIAAVLLAMTGILAALVAIGDPQDRQSSRVWVFQQPAAGISHDKTPYPDRHHKSPLL